MLPWYAFDDPSEGGVEIQNRECKLGRKQVLHLLETLDRFTLAREKMLYFYHDSREATISGHMPIPKLRPRLDSIFLRRLFPTQFYDLPHRASKSTYLDLNIIIFFCMRCDRNYSNLIYKRESFRHRIIKLYEECRQKRVKSSLFGPKSIWNTFATDESTSRVSPRTVPYIGQAHPTEQIGDGPCLCCGF